MDALLQWSPAFLALACVILVLLQWARFSGLRRRLQAREAGLESLESELRALLTASRGMGQRLQRQQQQLKTLLQRQDQLELQDDGGSQYRTAVGLARQGLPPAELAARCGLTQGEAELIARLHH